MIGGGLERGTSKAARFEVLEFLPTNNAFFHNSKLKTSILIIIIYKTYYKY